MNGSLSSSVSTHSADAPQLDRQRVDVYAVEAVLDDVALDAVLEVLVEARVVGRKGEDPIALCQGGDVYPRAVAFAVHSRPWV